MYFDDDMFDVYDEELGEYDFYSDVDDEYSYGGEDDFDCIFEEVVDDFIIYGF